MIKNKGTKIIKWVLSLLTLFVVGYITLIYSVWFLVGPPPAYWSHIVSPWVAYPTFGVFLIGLLSLIHLSGWKRILAGIVSVALFFPTILSLHYFDSSVSGGEFSEFLHFPFSIHRDFEIKGDPELICYTETDFTLIYTSPEDPVKHEVFRGIGPWSLEYFPYDKC